jgi:Do/DeqQ family serine protease
MKLAMNKNISTIVSAFAGGMLSLGAYHFLVPTKTRVQLVEKQAPVKYTDDLLIPPGGNKDFVLASEKTVNAVVHIKTLAKKKNTGYSDPFEQFFFGNPFRDNGPQMGSGSGIIISDDGYIVTNNHVIAEADEIEVTLNDKRTFKGKLVGTDPNTDIAVIKIEQTGMPFIAFSNSDDIKVGEWVLAVGNPFNLTSTVTAGIVSAKGRNIDIIQSNYKIESFIQTDAAVNPGNSGGALVNTEGELVGMNTAIQTHTGSFEGYSFAIPSNLVKKIAMDLIEFGTVQRGLLGVNIKEIDADFANEKGLEKIEGVWVEGTTSGSAADDAGIRQGDVILKIEDAEVNTVAGLQEHIGLYRPGDNVLITLKRNGEIKQVTAKLKNKQGNTEVVNKPVSSNALLGATFEEADAGVMGKLGLKNGVQVAEVTGGKLRSAGVRPGFIVTEINGKAIDSPEAIDKVLESNTKGYYVISGYYPSGDKVVYSFN